MLRIATCDDNEISRSIIDDLLDEYRYMGERADVLSFSLPSQLLSAVDDIGFFDLYVLDFVMPEMNGVQLAAELRRRGDNGKVIFLSGNRDGAFDAFEVGAFKYLLKPIDRNTLFSSLDRAIMEKNEEIIRANRARNTFITNVSHEMRTPLTIISSYAQMLQIRLQRYPDAAADKSVADKLRGISGEAMKLGELVSLMASHSLSMADSIKNSSLNPNLLEFEFKQLCVPLMTRGNVLDISFEKNLPQITGSVPVINEIAETLLRFVDRQCSPGSTISLHAGIVPEIQRVRITIDYTASPETPQSIEDILETGWSTSGGDALGLSMCRDSMRLMGGAFKAVSGPENRNSIKLTFHN